GMKLASVISVAACAAMASATLAQTNAPPHADWITATNQPCKIWNPMPQPNESVTWSGECKDGYASGEGVLSWTENGKPDVVFRARYANGKRNGPGVIIDPDGKRFAGNWLNDQLVNPADRNSI